MLVEPGFHHLLWAAGPSRQDGILRPIGNLIGNRPLGASAAPQSRPINNQIDNLIDNRPQNAILPYFGLHVLVRRQGQKLIEVRARHHLFE
jgi:hypothetical protein